MTACQGGCLLCPTDCWSAGARGPAGPSAGPGLPDHDDCQISAGKALSLAAFIDTQAMVISSTARARRARAPGVSGALLAYRNWRPVRSDSGKNLMTAVILPERKF